MNEQIRILHIVSALDGGGVEMMLMNYCTRVDDDNIKFDFIVHGSSTGDIEKEMTLRGFNIYHVTPKKESLIKNICEIDEVIKKGNYNIVHVHQNGISYIALYLAKKRGVSARIVHAHGYNEHESLIKKIKGKIFRIFNFMTATDFWACGEYAGKWLYGKRWDKISNKYIMFNAINTDSFMFSEKNRLEYRRQLDVEEKIVLIYVARIEKGKNQEFLLPVMSGLDEIYHLLLVGNGKEEEKIRQLISEMKLSNKVTMLGRRTDISELLSCSDLFLFPSKHEGLGIVSIEAQANGLPVIASTGIPMDTHLTDIIEHVPLNTDLWISNIQNAKFPTTRDRVQKFAEVEKSGYSINREVKKYVELVLKMVARDNNGDIYN